MNKKRKSIIDGNEISTIRTYNLGGFKQKVLVEGKQRDLPVVIVLHGGPGTPVPFCVGSRGLFPDITDRFILVSWDQYGSGINNAKITDNFSIDDFVIMTKDLVSALKREFVDNKIYLFAMSWGSVLSANVALDIPEMIDGVFVYGQVLNRLMRTSDVREAIQTSKAPTKLKQKVDIIFGKEVAYRSDILVMSKCIRKYTEGYTNRSEPKANISRMMLDILFSPDYRLKDFIAIGVNGYLKNKSIIDDLNTVDLASTLENISVPYHIIQGETDIVTSTREMTQFIGSSQNKFLELSIVSNAAHIPGENGLAKVMEVLNNLEVQTQ